MADVAHLKQIEECLADPNRQKEACSLLRDRKKCGWDAGEYAAVTADAGLLDGLLEDIALGKTTRVAAAKAIRDAVLALSHLVQRKLESLRAGGCGGPGPEYATPEAPDSEEDGQAPEDEDPLNPAGKITKKAVSMAVKLELSFERIIGINNLKSIAWLELGLARARSVARIRRPDGILGTGWLIEDGWLLTNHHVLPDALTASNSQAEFNYQTDVGGTPLESRCYELSPEGYASDEKLDYALVRIKDDAGRPLSDWRTLPVDCEARPLRSEHVNIIQHPRGGYKQVAVTANQVTDVPVPSVQYTTDTMRGSSGSPVLNDAWRVVALHHASVRLPGDRAGRGRYVNQGTLLSAIREHLGDRWPVRGH